MRLPFMLRATHDAVVAAKDAEISRVSYIGSGAISREAVLASNLSAEGSRLQQAYARTAALEAERALWEQMYTDAAEALKALKAAHIVFSDRCAEDLRAERERYTALTLQVVELKRAEAGLPPMAFDATLLDPMNSLGPKTQLAINDFAGGDREMQKYLVGRAALEWSALKGQLTDIGEVDKKVAEMVRRGDG